MHNNLKNLVPLFDNIPQDNIPTKKQKTFRNCLADIFNEIIYDRKIPLAKVQRETNIPFPTLDDWIKGRTCPLADDNLMVLARYLNTNIEFLCYGIGCGDSFETQNQRLAEYFNVDIETIQRITEGDLIKEELEQLATESIEWNLRQ